MNPGMQALVLVPICYCSGTLGVGISGFGEMKEHFHPDDS
jgi:hypothetical protein